METTAIDVLKDLIEVTTDSADGYSDAAEVAGTSRYKSMFASRGAERRELVRQLQQELALHGGESDSSGSALAAAHRRFLELRNALTMGDEAIIDEVERGEDYITAKYERAVRGNDLSASTRAVILRAYESVRAGHDQVRDLKDAGVI
ncbi:MAG: PA2169 family four-helix-bundle protein [Gammaproteobacteria bacterium]